MDKMHLLTINELEQEEIVAIWQRASNWQQGKLDHQPLINRFVANIFFESSTRTRFSFEIAAKKLGAYVLNFQKEISSQQKGEKLYDTLRTLKAQGAEAFVIRLTEEGLLGELAKDLKVPIINAGEGKLEHPTQALLDTYTILKYFPSIEGLNVAIIGDILHSRVANSNYYLLKKFKANLIFSGPDEFMNDRYEDVEYLPFEDALKKADVIIMLRVQLERHKGINFSAQEYHQKYGLTGQRLNLIKENAIILHPAPVNWGVEIAENLTRHPKIKIFEQINYGVFIRMAVLERAFNLLTK